MSNVSDGGSGLFDTVVKLVNVGFAGVGVVVLLLVFIILFQGKPADSGTNKLRNRFLTLGMEPVLDTPEEFAKIVRTQHEKDSALVKGLDLKTTQ